MSTIQWIVGRRIYFLAIHPNISQLLNKNRDVLTFLQIFANWKLSLPLVSGVWFCPQFWLTLMHILLRIACHWKSHILVKYIHVCKFDINVCINVTSKSKFSYTIFYFILFLLFLLFNLIHFIPCILITLYRILNVDIINMNLKKIIIKPII